MARAVSVRSACNHRQTRAGCRATALGGEKAPATAFRRKAIAQETAVGALKRSRGGIGQRRGGVRRLWQGET